MSRKLFSVPQSITMKLREDFAFDIFIYFFLFQLQCPLSGHTFENTKRIKKTELISLDFCKRKKACVHMSVCGPLQWLLIHKQFSLGLGHSEFVRYLLARIHDKRHTMDTHTHAHTRRKKNESTKYSIFFRCLSCPI